jgi:hypothetical protein
MAIPLPIYRANVRGLDVKDTLDVDEVLAEAADQIAHACPSLKLITFWDPWGDSHLQFYVARNGTGVVQVRPRYPQGELDGTPIRFWMPPVEEDVWSTHQNSLCSKTVPYE